LRYSNSRYARLSSSWPVSNNVGDLVLWDDDDVQLRCVIVDDDEAFIKVARAVLERDGVTVAGAAGNCAEAVQRAQALRPDVVLIDIRLGKESGFDVARRLADNEQAASLIMISTHAGADYADLIAESPAAGFVPKAQLSGAAIRDILGTD
jgi:CheY-like chemotaxis protein